MEKIRKHARVFVLCSLLVAVATMAILVNLPQRQFTAHTSSFTFAAAGDFNSDPNDERTGPLLDRLRTSGVDFLLGLGDLGYTEDEQTWCSQAKARFNNIIVIAGNHDSDEDGPSDISTTRIYCPFPFGTVNSAPGFPADGYGYAYYFDYPTGSPLARIFMVPFGNEGCVSEQASFCFSTVDWDAPTAPARLWFENAVADAKSRGLWVIAGMHEDCISSSMRGCDTGDDNWSDQNEFDMMISLKVDLLLFAHNHVYDRSKQLNIGPLCSRVEADPAIAPADPDCIVDDSSPYMKGAGSVVVIQGTGGAGLYDVACDSVYFVASMNEGTSCPSSAGSPGGRGAVKYTVSQASITARTDFDTSYQDSFVIESCQPNCPLSTSFSYSPTSIDVGTSITFTAQTSGGTSPYTYDWDFGDGATASGNSVTHAFSSTGTFIVTLTVVDSSSPSQSQSTTRTLTVPSTSSQLSTGFTTSPGNPAEGAAVTFTASAAGGSPPYSYDWDFGDGVTANGESVSHTFSRAGAYTVTLTTTDSTGESLTASRLVSVTSPGSGPGSPSSINDVGTLVLISIVSGVVGGIIGVSAVFAFSSRRRGRQVWANSRGRQLLYTA